MTDDEINLLIKTRNAITDRRDLEYNPDTASIDALLETVPPGTNNEVDLLLGRACATLEKYAVNPSWFINPVVTMADESTQASDKIVEAWHDSLAQTRRDWNDIKGDLAL